MVERWQKDAEGILIFVSLDLLVDICFAFLCKRENYRPVYSPLLSPRSLL